MTVDELKEQLRSLGIEPDSWHLKDPGKTIPASHVFKKQEEILLKIEELLEGQLGQERAKLADLHIALNRAKYGSGR